MYPAKESPGIPMHPVPGWNTTKAWMTGSFKKRKKDTGRRHKMVWSDKRETGIFFSFLFIWLKKPEERRKRCR